MYKNIIVLRAFDYYPGIKKKDSKDKRKRQEKKRDKIMFGGDV